MVCSPKSTGQLFLQAFLIVHLQNKIEKMMHKDTGAGNTGTDTNSSSNTAHQKPGMGQNVKGALAGYDATTSTGGPLPPFELLRLPAIRDTPQEILSWSMESVKALGKQPCCEYNSPPASVARDVYLGVPELNR